MRAAIPMISTMLAAGCGRPAPAAPIDAPAIGLAEARAVFADAAALCTADHGALWGVALCGPIMVVDRDSRFVVANQADELGKLAAQGGVFVGLLPPDDTIANTAVTWGGVRWTQLVWPLPADRTQRGVLVMHESFHRVAAQLAVPELIAKDADHLDTADGRYWLQLEWRALAAALAAKDDAARKAAIGDALAFRAARRAEFADAAASEAALELNEGLAEYTGVKLGARDPIAAALRDLAAHVDDPSFVRSFAYATGPAYGLLLDRFAPAWKQQLAQAPGLADALAAALGGAAAVPDAEAAAARYAGPALRQAEAAREATRAAQIAAYQRALVDGPVLRLAFHHMKIEFDPRNVLALGDHGSVYPKLHVVDDWGTLDAAAGALLAADFAAVTVAAPASAGARTGPGWTLQLKPGWRLVAGPRAGDWQLARDEAPTRTSP